MEQQVEVAVDSAGRLIISAPGVTFKLVPTVEPPPVDPPPVDPPPVDPPPVDPPPVATGHIWVDVTTLPGKPRSGRGWNNMYSMAKGDMPGPVTVKDQNSMNSAWAQACSYVYAATGETVFLTKTLNVFKALVSPTLPIDRALALAREVQGYVAAAEGIQLARVDADLDAAVKAKFRYFLTCPTKSGPASLTKSMEDRANNWGTHAMAAVLLTARYIGDTDVFNHAVQVFRGFLGDRSAYAGFKFDQPGWEEWQELPDQPVGINRKGATIQGHNMDGSLPEELRRGGAFSWPLPATMPTPYPWEAEQGITAAVAVALNAGVDLRPASDWAHKRSILWLLNVAKWPISGDDSWQAPVLNVLYPDLKLAVPDGSPGKGLAWTEFTHQ